MPTAYPYESQWGDLACNAPLIEQGRNPALIYDWRIDGYPSEASYEFWARHVCGLACLRSVLGAWGPAGGVPPMFELITGALRNGAFTETEGTVGGLFYRPFLDWVRERFGFDGAVHADIDATELLGLVDDDRVAFASVSSEIRYPDRPNDRRGGHLVLVHRFDGETVVFHNPSGVRDTAADAHLDIATFSRFFAGRGFTVNRPGRCV